MSIAAMHSAVLQGTNGHPVIVETHVSTGCLPSFTIVGVADAACRETRDRVRAAINSTDGIAWPSARVTVHIAGGAGARFAATSALDLPIALAVLAADGQLSTDAVSRFAAIGELGLNGSVRHVRGSLPLAMACGAVPIVVAAGDGAREARLIAATVHAVATLGEAVHAVGNPHADVARALTIAAAGGHHCAFVGPAGGGRTLLARRFGELLPDLAPGDSLEVSRIHSAAGFRLTKLVTRPPVRIPHYSASNTAMIGGGSHLAPGEVSAAHAGVLVLDDLAEFAPATLDAVQHSRDAGETRIARASATAVFPSRFQLLALFDRCPCQSGADCRCTDAAVSRYARRIVGPLANGLAIWVDCDGRGAGWVSDVESALDAGNARDAVARCRERAARRGWSNNQRTPGDVITADRLTGEAMDAVCCGMLTARSANEAIRVAATIADLAGRDTITAADAGEAIALRTGR